VHGDIRGFKTTVFSAVKEQGWMIDFDFGGKEGKEDKETIVFPRGYNRKLDDSLRYGKDEALVKKWHDWYALGQLIFHCHRFEFFPAGADELRHGLLSFLVVSR
jgi:hypothetical protein